MKQYENIIVGSSSMIGTSMIKKIDHKNTIFISRKKLKTIKKGTWIKQDLNKKINYKIPKMLKKIFFLSSPYYINRNLFKNIILSLQATLPTIGPNRQKLMLELP